MKKLEFKLSASEGSRLAKLAESWVAVEFLKERAARVQFDDGSIIELISEGNDVTKFFECFRLRVKLSRGKLKGKPPPGFSNGAMKISVLQSEEWLESERRLHPPRGLLGDFVGNHHIGVPGSAPLEVEFSCVLDSGLLLVAPTGERLIIRCDAMPYWLAITDDDGVIERDLENYRVRELV